MANSLKDDITGITIKGDDFFIDGKKTKLAGNHTWNTVQSVGGEIIKMDKITGNFTRLWTLETRAANFEESPWGSNTPGTVRIGNSPWKKDGSLNGRYYKALENAVKAADERGITVGVCLFEGTLSTYFRGSDYISWKAHPFNGLGPADTYSVHTKGSWNKYQRAHVKRVTETLEKYDNVMYEVGNELPRDSIKWFQAKVIEWVNKFTNKPVGASYAQGMKASRGRTQDWLTGIGADWIAPSGSTKLPGFKGPQILDTDHAWPLYSNVTGLKSAWNDGRSLWVMDGFNGTMLRNQNSLKPDLYFIDSVI
jgi:hypothetical protein